jgi:Reverse transcriptase (RNA-dependent DNA polymerase)
MQQPMGFEESGKKDWVWQLQRGLYGMKQSGRIWNRTLNTQMINWGFTRLACESCIYYRRSDSGIIIAAVHVDDYLSIADSKDENERFKDQMRQVWTISELGTARFIVGIAVTWDRTTQTVALSQTALIDKIIEQFGQKDAHPVSAPLEPGSKLRRTDRQSMSSEDQLQLNKLPYRSLVGCLLYLAILTRPDISYVVQQLSQYLDCYSFEHWGAAIRSVRYLKGTKDLKLYLGGDHPINLQAFSDSDWANCLDTRRSVGSYVCSLGSSAVSWTACKQKVVATSSCEAEYVAAFETAKECIWLHALLKSSVANG